MLLCVRHAHSGPRVRRDAGGLDVVVYCDLSTPYLDADVRTCLLRLRGDAEPLDRYRDGSWLAVATVRGAVAGCARAVRSPADRPARPSPALRALGPDRYDEWLAGGLELVEVVVDERLRRSGVGAALVAAVLTPARHRRAWARPRDPGAERAAGWLRDRGWTTVATDRDTADEILLEPRHPALRAGDPSGPTALGPSAGSTIRRPGV